MILEILFKTMKGSLNESGCLKRAHTKAGIQAFLLSVFHNVVNALV
ncbi:MAG: hypothetical protein Q4A84_06485 [Neisseria sp.]|nr:hypothetical protein [Neisseria sp.]MDO4641333.1 hypothetical protein [Neisseria sp.]